MYMSEKEIVAKYKRNGCTHEQIAIIADLNGVPDCVIRDILLKHGAINNKPKQCPKTKRAERAVLTAELEQEIVNLQQKGFTQKQIAIKCNITTKTISKVYKKYHLKGKNSGKKLEKKSKTPDDIIEEILSKTSDPEYSDTVKTDVEYLEDSVTTLPQVNNCDKAYSSELLTKVIEKIDSKAVRWRSEPRFMQICKDLIIRVFRELEI